MNLRGAIGSVALVCLAVPLVGGIGVGASADTLLVSPDGTGEYPTIQGAIDAAVDGDVIELADGTYRGEGNRDIEYLGKAITVQSASGDPTACILNCEGPGNRGFHFRHDEGPASVLVGVTVMNGSPPGVWSFDGGGAIRCNPNASPTIANCVFRDNWAINGSDWSWDGGAIAAYSTPGPSVTNCSFFDCWRWSRSAHLWWRRALFSSRGMSLYSPSWWPRFSRRACLFFAARSLASLSR
jgi:hypothetical protein